MSQSAHRVLDVLELFLTQEDLGVSETARYLGVDKSTVSRLFRTLQERDFLVFDEGTQRFRPGVSIMRLAGVLHKRTDLRTCALPVMKDLCARSGETVSLQVRVGTERVGIEQVESPKELRRVVQLGVPMPLFPGATGKALAAFAPEVVEKNDLQQLWPTATKQETRWLDRELKDVRDRGYAISINERVDGIAGIAAPIVDYDASVVAALAVSGPSTRWTLERMEAFAPQLLDAVRRVSRQLGADVPSPIAQ